MMAAASGPSTSSGIGTPQDAGGRTRALGIRVFGPGGRRGVGQPASAGLTTVTAGANRLDHRRPSLPSPVGER